MKQVDPPNSADKQPHKTPNEENRAGSVGHADGQVEHILRLQRTIGNQATSHLLKANTAEPAIQRRYIDEPASGKNNWNADTFSYIWYLSSPWQQGMVTRVSATLGKFNNVSNINTVPKLKQLISDLQTELDNWKKSYAPGGVWNKPFQTLEGEVTRLLKVINDVELLDNKIEPDDVYLAPAALEKRRELSRLRAEAQQMNKDINKGEFSMLTTLKDPSMRINTLVKVIQDTLGYYVAEFGEAKEGSKKAGLFEDFQNIEGIMSDRSSERWAEMQEMLRPMDERLGGEKGATLEGLLSEHEGKMGFPNVDVIPMGVLPPEEFLDLIKKGLHFGDFGAGPGHGELSHRIQWHIISKYMQEGEWNNSVTDVYKALGDEQFTEGALTGKAVWGRLVDKSAGETGPNSPMDVNQNLMGKPNFRAFSLLSVEEKQGVIDELKNGNWDHPNVKKVVNKPEKLANIAQSLLIRSLERYKDYPRERNVSNEPTPEIAKEFRDKKVNEEGYEVLKHGEGTFDNVTRPWELLIKSAHKETYESLK